MSSSPSPLAARLLLPACMAAFSFANLTTFLQPVLISGAIAGFALSSSQAAATISLEYLGIVAVLVGFALRPPATTFSKLGWAGGVIAIAAHCLSYVAPSYGWLLIARCIAGAAEGAVLMAVNALMAGMHNPTRASALVNLVSIVFGSAVFFALPWMMPGTADRTAFLITGIACAVVLPLFLGLPSKALPAVSARADASKLPLGRDTVLLLASNFAMIVSSGIVWAFLMEIGRKAQMSDHRISVTIGAASLVGIAGPLLVTLISHRVRRLTAMYVVLAVALTLNVATVLIRVPAMFQIGACMNIVCAYILMPYYFGLTAEQDRTGRSAAILGGLTITAFSVAPFLAGLFVDRFGLDSIVIPIVGAFMLAIGLLFAFSRHTAAGHPASGPLEASAKVST